LYSFLARAREAAQLKFLEKAPLINEFDQTRPFIAMHLDGGANDGFG
jgi:hypothetical protein